MSSVLASPREPKIYECLLIIEFDEEETEVSQRAKIKYTYPEMITDATIVRSAPLFCFPEERVTLSWEQKKYVLTWSAHTARQETVTEEFSFVLTAVDGSKRFGFCRRFLVRPVPEWRPLCYCLISTWSTFALFRVILDVVEVVQPQGIIALDKLLEGVRAMRMPARGRSLSINVLVPTEENTESQVLDPVIVAERRRGQGSKRGGAKGFLDYAEEQRTFNIVRPDTDYEFLDYVTFEPLFARFSVRDVLIMFTALLRERRVLVVSAALSTLTGIINALVALVAPFSWQHVFIPILPRNLVEFVEAPMPYVIGVLKQAKAQVFARQIEAGTLMINADKGEFFSVPEDDPDIVLPAGAGASLRRALERVQQSDQRASRPAPCPHSSLPDGLSFSKLIAHCFLKFWTELFKDYHKYFGPDGSFDTERFLRSRSSSTRPFLADMVASQMVEVFLREREAAALDGTLAEDPLVARSVSDLRALIDAELGPRGKLKDVLGFGKTARKDPRTRQLDSANVSERGSGGSAGGMRQSGIQAEEETPTILRRKAKSKDERERDKRECVLSLALTARVSERAEKRRSTLTRIGGSGAGVTETVLDSIVEDTSLLAAFTEHVRGDVALAIALDLYCAVRALSAASPLPATVLQRVALAGAVTLPGKPAGVPVLPLPEALQAHVRDALEGGAPSGLGDELAAHLRRLLLPKAATFRSDPATARSDASDDSSDEQRAGPGKRSVTMFGRMRRQLTRSMTGSSDTLARLASNRRPDVSPRLSPVPAAPEPEPEPQAQHRRSLERKKSSVRRFEPVVSRFTESGGTAVPGRSAVGTEAAPAMRRVLGVGRDVGGSVLGAYPHCQAVVRSGDGLVEFTVFLPLLRVRFPPIDAYKHATEAHYALPLGAQAVTTFLNFIFADRIGVGLVTAPEDLLDLIRFCGVHNTRLRSELLTHFLAAVRPENVAAFLLTATSVQADPASARELERALGYLKAYFVRHWDQVIGLDSVAALPSALLLELARMHVPQAESSVRALEAALMPTRFASDDDTLSRALLVLWTVQDGCDHTLRLAGRPYAVHRYVLAVNVPAHRLAVDGAESEVPTMAPDVLEALLHYAYALDFHAVALPVPTLALAQELWRTGLNLLQGGAALEQRLAAYLASALTVRTLGEHLLALEDEAYAPILRATVLEFAARNVASLARSPALVKLSQSTLVGVIEKLG